MSTSGPSSIKRPADAHRYVCSSCELRVIVEGGMSPHCDHCDWWRCPRCKWVNGLQGAIRGGES